mmetsp:Transcript_27214/g.63675  ORF Transcript_27214/g.63675 Transcript_27214/m.63675 type:complete len:317 (+) Transcript_27214:1151-2101(+)
MSTTPSTSSSTSTRRSSAAWRRRAAAPTRHRRPSTPTSTGWRPTRSSASGGCTRTPGGTSWASSGRSDTRRRRSWTSRRPRRRSRMRRGTSIAGPPGPARVASTSAARTSTCASPTIPTPPCPTSSSSGRIGTRTAEFPRLLLRCSSLRLSSPKVRFVSVTSERRNAIMMTSAVDKITSADPSRVAVPALSRSGSSSLVVKSATSANRGRPSTRSLTTSTAAKARGGNRTMASSSAGRPLIHGLIGRRTLTGDSRTSSMTGCPLPNLARRVFSNRRRSSRASPLSLLLPASKRSVSPSSPLLRGRRLPLSSSGLVP